MRPALRAGGKPVLAAAKANAPKKSGSLRKSLKLRAGKRSRRGIYVVTLLLSTSKDDNLFTGKAFYGAFQEFGFKLGKRIGGKATRDGRKVSQRLLLGGRWITLKAGKYIAGRHFLEQAHKQKGPESLKIIMQKLASGLETVAKGN
jgi:HK97 gp10 family phage protein